MMNLCFSTLPCRNLNEGELVALCKKYKIPAVEIRTDSQDGILGTNSISEVKSKGVFLAQNGVSVTNLGTSIRFCGYDEALLQKALKHTQMAQAIGAKGIRIFLGNFWERLDGEKKTSDYKGLVRVLRELCKAGNSEIWIETHNEFTSGASLVRLIEDIGSSKMKIIWDPMHSLEDGEPFEKTWSVAGAYITHLHIKDGRKKVDPTMREWEYTRLGRGEVPNKEIAALLNKNGFSGYLSLEWENAWREELRMFPEDIHWLLNEFIKYMESLTQVDI